MNVTVSNISLVAAYSVNEGVGTTLTDLSGQNNNGTLVNIAAPPTASSGWTTAGKYGGALSLMA